MCSGTAAGGWFVKLNVPGLTGDDGQPQVTSLAVAVAAAEDGDEALSSIRELASCSLVVTAVAVPPAGFP